jgi:hypothetical protein
MGCASAVSSVIDGVGPFTGFDTSLPTNIYNRLLELQAQGFVVLR